MKVRTSDGVEEHQHEGEMKIKIRKINVGREDVIILSSKDGAAATVTTVASSSAHPVIEGDGLRILGDLSLFQCGYHEGSPTSYRRYRHETRYVWPGTIIPHEDQVPEAYTVAIGAMYWESHPDHPVTKQFDEDVKMRYWRIVYRDNGTYTFWNSITPVAEKLWHDVSLPLLSKTLKEIEDGNLTCPIP